MSFLQLSGATFCIHPEVHVALLHHVSSIKPPRGHLLFCGTEHERFFFFFGTTCPMVEALQFSLHAAASPFRPRATLNTTRKRARLEGCSIRWAFKIKSSTTNVTLNKTRTFFFFFKHVVNIKYSIVNPRNKVNLFALTIIKSRNNKYNKKQKKNK